MRQKMKQPEVEIIKYSEEGFLDIVLSKMEGHVFHVTSREGYEGIIKQGIIRQNGDGSLPHTYGHSPKSAGNLNNSVCLFDFRSFPGWNKWGTANPNLLLDSAYQHKPVFLIMGEEIYPKLEQAYKYKYYNDTIGTYVPTYVPNVECLFPGDIDLQKFPILKVYRTEIHYEKDPDAIDLGEAMKNMHEKVLREKLKH